MTTAGLAVLAGALTPWLAYPVAASGAAGAFVAFPGPLRDRALAAVFVATAAIVPFFPEAAWPVAGLLAAYALTSRPHGDPTFDDLQRHLAWCRRRGENAAVVVMHVPASAAPTAAELRDVMRLTDSVHVQDGHGGYHLAAIVDRTDLSRPGLERRIHDRLGDVVTFGWASFPADGVTLAVLLDVAGADLARRSQPAVPVEAPPTARAASPGVAR